MLVRARRCGEDEDGDEKLDDDEDVLEDGGRVRHVASPFTSSRTGQGRDPPKYEGQGQVTADRQTDGRTDGRKQPTALRRRSVTVLHSADLARSVVVGCGTSPIIASVSVDHHVD